MTDTHVMRGVHMTRTGWAATISIPERYRRKRVANVEFDTRAEAVIGRLTLLEMFYPGHLHHKAQIVPNAIHQEVSKLNPEIVAFTIRDTKARIMRNIHRHNTRRARP